MQAGGFLVMKKSRAVLLLKTFSSKTVFLPVGKRRVGSDDILQVTLKQVRLKQ